MRRLRSPVIDYSLLQWIVYVFLGGAIDAVIIQNFVSWGFSVSNYLEEQHLTALQVPEAIIFTVVFGSILFLFPVVFSFLFTRWHLQKRIVPPLYMQLIAFGLLLFFVYNVPNSNNITTVYMLVLYVLIGRIAQDRIVTYALGKNALADNIIRHSLKVHSNITKAQEILMIKPIRNKTYLKRIIKQEGESLKLKTPRNHRIQFILELKQGTESDETIVNTAIYEEEAYSIKKTDAALEFDTEKVAYLEAIFRRNSMRVVECSSEGADSLVDYVLDEKQGAIARLQEMPTERRIKIFLAIVLIITGIGLSVSGAYFETGLITLITGIGLAIDTFARSRP